MKILIWKVLNLNINGAIISVTKMVIKNFILNAESLMDVANYPPFHFEHLKGDRKDEWSIRLGNTGYRVTMIPCDNDGNEITEGDILAQCKMIKIVKVTEVSNHYE